MSNHATEEQQELGYDSEDGQDSLTRPQRMLIDLIMALDKESNDPDILKNDQRLRQNYQGRVRSLISASGNFVQDVLEHQGHVMVDNTNEEVMFRVVHKKFLLDIAIREKWSLLAERAHGTGRTALHKAVEVDQSLKTDKHERSFTWLCCDVMEYMVEHKEMTQTNAAAIISTPNSEGDTCLHEALRADFDFDVASRLIKLADDTAFRQQGTDGNTPLHEALKFPRTDQKSLRKHRYLVQAPRCPTPGRLAPVGVFQLPMSEQTTFCARCRATDKRYWQVKERQCRIICALVEKYPLALTIRNKTGKSPFSYHVMAREAVKADNPDFSSVWNQRKLVHRQQEKSTIKLNRSSAPNRGDIQWGGGVGAGSPVLGPAGGTSTPKTPVDGAQLANVGSIRASRGSISQGSGDPARNTNEQDIMPPPTAKANCTPEAGDMYELSVEIEKFLWDKAFSIGGYTDARQCLFPLPCAGSGNSGEDPPDKEERQEIFIPTRRVTMKTKKRYLQWKFLPTLAYVHLRVTPDQDIDKDPSGTADGRAKWTEKISSALKSLFTWLTNTKGVKRIVMLVVEDNDLFPCSEAAMRDCLRKLDEVRYLDWRRPDISVQTLREAKNVTEVWLQSTGLNAVLSGWADKGGLQTLNKLRKVNIQAKKGMETEEGNKANVLRFREEFKKWYDEKRKAPEVVVKYESTGPVRGNVPTGDGGVNGDRSSPWIDKVRDWTTDLRNKYAPKVANDESDCIVNEEDEGPTNYIKVALLDDGVDPEYDDLGKFMSGSGWPRPSEAPGKHKQPESFFSAGEMKHGNDMASLIVTMCPFVSLYVAKINASPPTGTARHPTFEVAQATQAIWWAIREKVDIISMSWNVLLSETGEDKTGLESALKEARHRGILLYCAASEKKQTMPNGKKPYPSALSETFSIGAASDNRVAHDYVGESRFLFPSDNNGVDGGSSAATALAAGLASLILYCLRSYEKELERTTMEKEEKTRDKGGQSQPAQKQGPSAPAAKEDPHQMMEKVFNSLCRDRSNGYVEIDELLGKEKGPATYKTVALRCLTFQTRENGRQKRDYHGRG